MSRPTYTLWQIVAYMLKLGAMGFGGPVALAGYMYRDLVEQRRWISEEDYKEGIALAQLMPGPMAAQLAIYLGFVHYGVLGATLAGLAFVLPSFLMVVGLGWAYTRYGGLSWMQATFYGVGAAVIGIIAMSAQKLSTKSLGKDKLLWAIWAVAAAATIITESEVGSLFLVSGVLVWLWRTKWRPSGSLSAMALVPAVASAPVSMFVTDPGILAQIAIFFAKAGAFVFGSGLAIVPFLYGSVVHDYHWLTEKQFVDAVAVAMITPGPVVITVGFIGYLVAGLPGAGVAAMATFLPCYLLTIVPAPYFKKYGKRPGLLAFIDGVTAAAVGAITGSVVVLARRSLIDGPTVLMALAVVVVLWRFKQLKEPWVIAAAALLGLALYPLLPHITPPSPL